LSDFKRLKEEYVLSSLDLFNVKNKTAIVTGGGRGLGEQIAEGLAEAGANVVVCSRKLEACERVSEKLKQMGVKALALQCDVTNQKQVEEVVKKTVEEFGGVDILVNNSGTSWTGPALDLPVDKWEKVMDVNVKGVFLFSQAVGKVMVEQGSGKIINIASLAGFGGAPPTIMDTIAYNTSKGAVITFTKDFSAKMAMHGIQVNAIAPGFFPTKITGAMLEKMYKQIVQLIPSGRLGTEEDLKGAAVFLSSRASDYITGQVLSVDGGKSALI
jgi:NAD(P)-dependent dehydrogenase (short-subunit alcohol dehydrogenase family)